MGRGRKENLRVPSSEEARKNGQKGGVNSGIARREKKLIQELLDMYTSKTHSVPDDDGNPQTKLAAAVASFVERQIESGDAAGFEKLMIAMGQKPADKVESKVQAQVVYGWED